MLGHMHIMEDTTAESMLRTAAAVDELTLSARGTAARSSGVDNHADQAPEDDLSDGDKERKRGRDRNGDWQKKAETNTKKRWVQERVLGQLGRLRRAHVSSEQEGEKRVEDGQC